MTHRFFSLLILLVTVIIVPVANGQNAPIEALLITGGGWHDFETQKKLLTEGISERLDHKIEWTIVHEDEGDPGHQVSVLKEPHWADNYDVVVHNTGFARVRDPNFVDQLVKYHKGTPAVLIHAAIQSYRFAEPSDGWFKFMGYQSMASEESRTLEIENIAPKNSIMKGFPATWTTSKEEIFIMEKEWGEITTLARAFGEEMQEFQPVTWTHEGDSTRVFATTLGHSNEIYQKKEFLEMVANGLLWAVGEL
ncbi:ThuA domain-containing protein [Fodinibius sediminis]|uniref:Trehalose utilisation n=1 Tax=Fodinibius sediminis TaxID=1214077 RepID=A0A521BFS5_9BACT|nr:ThuA domain-containing protein [Fodinibius sediminis]SMO45912.1 Trehalose utilisation [Fodinibius sediminis]